MEVWLYLIRIVFILLIFLFLQNIINTIQKDIETEPEEEKPPKHSKFKLEVVKGADKIKLIRGDIDSLEEINLGRETTNDIVVDDKYISTNHFKIKKINNLYFIEDSGSTNGTFLNGNLLTDRIKLKNNDIISLGSVHFRVNIY